MLTPQPATPRSHRKLIIKLLTGVAAAFAFGFMLVPLYDVICKATGLNGKTANTPAAINRSTGFSLGGFWFNNGNASNADASTLPSRIDRSRTVSVEFTGTVMPGLPWEMRPLTFSLDIHPGELQLVKYLVRNTSDQTITGQAIPSITPGQAAQHFEKIECFCFTQQTLAPGEAREIPLSFILKPEVDKDIRHITISYAFFSAVASKPSRNDKE